MKDKVFNPEFIIWLIVFLFSVNLAQAKNQRLAFNNPGLTNFASQNYTYEAIQERIQAIQEKQNLSEEVKKRLLSAYQESADNLKDLQAQENKAEALKNASNTLPLESKQLQKRILEADKQLKNPNPEKLIAIPTDELEQRLINDKTHLSDLDEEIARNEVLINEVGAIPQMARAKITELKTRQSATQQEQLELSGKSAYSQQEKEARQIQYETRMRLLNSTQKTFELENINAPMLLQLQKDRRHLLTLQREHQATIIAELENYLSERRQQQINQEQEDLLQAEKEAEGKNPLIRETTKQNIQYNKRLQTVNNKIEQFVTRKNEIDNREQEVEKDFHSAEQKINLAGLSPALGNLLREQRRNLPQRKQFNELNDEIQNEIATASLEMFELDEAKKSLIDVNQTLLTRIQQQMPAGMTAADTLRLRTDLRILLNDQKDLVERLSTAYLDYARVLGDVDFTLQQLLNSSEKFGSFLDQRLLWVPSAPVITQAYLSNIMQSAYWFFGPSNWLQVVKSLQQGVKTNPVLLLVSLVAIIGLNFRFKKSIKNNLHAMLSKGGAKLYLVSFNQTLNSLGLLLLLSLFSPLFMVWAAWGIRLLNDADVFSRAFAGGLLAAAVSLAVVQFFYRLFKPEGIAELLFHWQKSAVQLLYSQFKWSRFIVIPCVFLVAMANTNLYTEHSSALGRTAQIVLMLTLSYILHRFAHPVSGLGKTYYQNSDSWLSRLRYVWYLLAVLAPWVVIGFSVMGYYQSALELQNKLIIMLRLVFMTALLHALVLRWLTVTKRQLALQNARQKRKLAEQATVSAGVEGNYVPEENLLDISKINQQSDTLLNTSIAVILVVGSWMIWRDILPALTIFDRVELWQHAEVLEGKEVLMPITLVDVFLSFFYSGLAFVFVTNFPALVDLFSVGKFALTAGSRYALIQLSRYLLVTIAFLAVANELGGSWAQVQWLVAALSVGLGFGLQEIFANMVSGIILLFERPIRVGDTVTVGDVTGRVCRIQMRATHILDWDRKELVVPNKTIITDRLVNWTLSDTVTRVVLLIGVAYGSDIELVEKVLRQVVDSEEAVLDDPEPMITFINFGESSLDFRISVHVRELGDRLLITHNLHKKFYASLQAHNIEIPFPQRDVHVRSVSSEFKSA